MNKFQLMTVEETAAILKISPGTLRNWVWKGRIPYVKLGKAVRFKKSDIEEFINKNTFKPSKFSKKFI